MIKKIFDCKDGRSFEFKVHRDFNGAMVCCDIAEIVHPERRFFRTRYLCHKSFWIADYPTVEEGLKNCLAHYLADEREWQENNKKFENFEKRA
jgi:hypothetical protein